ncbi:MAG: hypothetical protein A2Y73_06740 [Chloroflexi bacterium RBG_13_56_8]|nr:MAG: hypothetical protein A2Y73_06740 [Chloroflexi bacterium RBG_13_56_8]
MKSHWRSLGAGLLLTVLPFLLFWQIWWPGVDPRPAFAHGDFVEQHYPMRVFVARELRQGHLPLWDPYTFGGEPAVAESLFEVFYPLGFWQAIFPDRLPFRALELEAIFHLGLAGVFTYLFVKQLTGRTEAGLLGGIAFSLGGYLTSYPMLQMIILEAAIWLPATLWLLELSFQKRSLTYSIAAGAMLALSVTAGHFQTVMYILYTVTAYFLFRAWQLKLGWRFTLKTALALGGVGLGLSAAQWLPSLQMARFSPRAALEYADVSRGFALQELWGFLRPNPGEWSPLYVGLLPLGSALAGLWLWRRREVWFWAVTIFLALLLSMGGNGFLYPLAYKIVPGFGMFRDQERIAFLMSFGLAVLAGYGYAALASKRWWPRFVAPLLLCLAFLDLFRANSGVILKVPPTGGYFAQSEVATHLEQANDGISRISSEGLLPGGPNAGLVFRIRDVTGSGPLYLAKWEQFLDSVPELRWWQMLNIRHVLTERRIDHGALKLVLEEGEERLYQLYLEGQPAWLAHAAKIVTDVDAAIRCTADPSLDPYQTVVLEEQPNPLPQPASGPENVRVVTFESRRVAVDVSLSTPGIVVLSEVSYPGWVARVNGQKVPSLRAFGVLRAVALPQGAWRVEWSYEPTVAWLGIAISALTLVSVGVPMTVRWQKDRVQRTPR